MIVQSSPDGVRHLVIEQLEHTRLAGRLAERWGNHEFAHLEPEELMLYVITHHDQGWEAIDAGIGRDPRTGLPYNLVDTPLPEIIKSGRRGPDFNQVRHPYCGLISSMHTVGLYTGRYGLSDKVFVDLMPAEHRPAVEDLLASERGRQQELEAALGATDATAAWVGKEVLFHNYKLLQFFDTLALYFNCTHEAARGSSTFLNVPRAVGDDVSVTVDRIDAGVYRVAPFPFVESGVEIACTGRWLEPLAEDADVAAALAAAPTWTETVTLVAP